MKAKPPALSVQPRRPTLGAEAPRAGFPARTAVPGAQPGETKGKTTFKSGGNASNAPAASVVATPFTIKNIANKGRGYWTNGQNEAQTPVKSGLEHRPSLPPSGAGLDSLAVRLAMVARLEAGGLANPWVLRALRAVERHRFVDSALINQAYEDTSLPIGLGQTISKPNVVGRMLALMLEADVASMGVPGAAAAGATLGAGRLPGRVLEIGTGCGYQAALLSHLAVGVVSIERLAGLHERAKANLAPMGIGNLQLVLGDGMKGHKAGAPYLAIVAAAGGESIPQAWIDQLAVGGRIVAPVHVPVAPGQAARQLLTVVDKTAQGLRQQTLDGVMFVPLKSGVS